MSNANHITLSNTERNIVVINRSAIPPDVAKNISDSINQMKSGQVIVVYSYDIECIKIHKLPENITEVTYE